MKNAGRRMEKFYDIILASKGEDEMSPALMKMWVSLSGMGFMVISVVLIYLSRYKFKNGVLKTITAIIAYILLLLAGLIIFFIVLAGPTNE
ncbi:DUF2768 domain-containing protein [Bacillus benzoevorans]|uniref:DUF2768 domain-containing protein n=2 Tax=Bacillus benzoevorans TaxID=1456 RepID=A0A7X0HPU1_9BACI|nr:hypothetical protein [Bacillus benzoevorans]